ncbi:hypothetical protein [Photobacterium kasasachensis]|uniref:hypothetical protein n=1 Tax=Photobacterium kasasachensis TaxID=2910240 RepID=UPI003D0FB282
MEVFERMYNMIIESPAIVIFLIITSLLVNYLFSRNAVKKKEYILEKIPQSDEDVHLDVKVAHSSRTFGAARVSWHRAEIIFSRNTIFYIAYSRLGPIRMYKNVMQLYVAGTNLQDQLIKDKFAPIQSIKFIEDKVIIKFAWSSPVIKSTLTLKGIDHEETIQAIKKQLDLDALQSM